ncbi:MAG: diaminopimelate epimerase [Fimbriimonas sp.]|nr:diaminopimelate epimerase [Fimbriimonas sp.]
MDESQSKLPFWKLQSIGNDFVLIHLDDLKVEADLDGALAQLAIRACNRRFGIGSDGLLAVSMSGSDVLMRMFNPDGTEDFCGNGLRCAAFHCHGAGWVGTAFTMRHLGREIAVTVDGSKVTTNIGGADYDPARVPQKNGELFNQTVWSGMDSGMPLSLFGSALTTGSTHVVIPTSCLPDDDSFRSISPKIETDPLYPQRTSVIWSQEIEPMKLKIRIWERGVGETLGCGTGSSAAAADYLRRKSKGGSVEVVNPGGSVTVSMDAWYTPITVEGIATEVYQGKF